MANPARSTFDGRPALPALSAAVKRGPAIHIRGEMVLWLLLVAIVFAVAILPLAYTMNIAFYRETRLGLSAVRSLDAIIDVYTTAEYLGPLAQCLLLAGLVTVLSLALGLTMALLVTRTDIPAKGTIELFIILPLFLSPFTGLIAWINLASKKTGFVNVLVSDVLQRFGVHVGPLFNVWSYSGVVWIMVLFFCPFAYLFTTGSLRGMDSTLEDAARTTGASAFGTLWHVTLPLALPAIFASGLLIFVLTAETYTVPGIVGATIGFVVLPWKIFLDSTTFPVHLAHAAAASTILLTITVFGIALQRHITRVAERFVTVGGKGRQFRPFRLGRWNWLAVGFVALFVVCADLLPFGALLLTSFMRYSASSLSWGVFTLGQYAELWNLPATRSALWNTTWLAVVSAGACVLVGTLISFMEVRRKSLSSSLLAFLGVLPVAVPGLVYGIGLMWLYLRTPLYGSPWVLLLAYFAKFLPFAIVISRSGILQTHRELDESARTCGASGITAFRLIALPLLKPTLVAILFFIMLMCIKELSASLLLYSDRSQVLSVLTWNYMASGNYQFAAALALVQTVIMVAIVFITRAIFDVRLESAVSK